MEPEKANEIPKYNGRQEKREFEEYKGLGIQDGKTVFMSSPSRRCIKIEIITVL